MKRKLTLGIFLAVLTTSLMAQDPMFSQGDKVLNLGIGFGSTLYSGSFYHTSVPALSASYEVGVKDGVLDVGSIGVGGYVGYSAFKSTYDYGLGTYGWKISNIIIGARGVFHYPLVDKLDTYTGLMLGFRIVSDKYYGSSTYDFNYSGSTSGVQFSWFAGGRYYFSDNLAGLLEIGYGISYINLGIALKM